MFIRCITLQKKQSDIEVFLAFMFSFVPMPSGKRSPRWLYETGRIYERKGGKCLSKKFLISVVSSNYYGNAR